MATFTKQQIENITKQQIENIKEAIEMWKTVPSKNVSQGLNDWRYEYNKKDLMVPATCNTVACFGGWCAHWPKFQAQGVGLTKTGAPTMDHGTQTACTVAERLFGDYTLFDVRGYHRFDIRSGFQSDHDVVMSRLTSLLKEAESYLSMTSV